MDHHTAGADPSAGADGGATGRRWIPIGVAVGIVATLAAIALAALTDSPIGLITRDVTTLCAEAGARLPPYAGSVSTLTIIVWTSVATLSLVAASLLQARRRWLHGFAGLLALLSADDALSLHEESETYIGLPETAFYVVYAALAIVLTLGSLRAVRRKDTPVTELVALLTVGFSWRCRWRWTSCSRASTSARTGSSSSAPAAGPPFPCCTWTVSVPSCLRGSSVRRRPLRAGERGRGLRTGARCGPR